MASDIDLAGLARHLDALTPHYLTDLEELVNIDSGTFDKAGVDRVGELLRTKYLELGASIEPHPHPVYGDSFVAEMTGGGQASILLLGHMDTVYPAGTADARPFRVQDGRAYGPGVADMKSGDLSIVYALRALQALGLERFARVVVVHNSDEEVGSPSSRDLIRRRAEAADAVLVLEAGRENGNIVSSRKGVADFRLHVRGRSAHAGVNRERGRSAALELAHLVVALEGLNGQVPGATLNVGRLEAGERPNVVPDYAFAHFETRAFEAERLHEMIARIQQIVEHRTVPETQAELETSINHLPMAASASARLLSLAQHLARRLQFSIEGVATGGASDGNTAAEAGKPVLDGLGPVGGHAHSPDEYLEISSIAPRTALLAGLIATLGGGAWESP